VTQPQVGSYDDAPETEVSTVLEVPLLWRSSRVSANPATDVAETSEGTPADANGRGAHRRPRQANHATGVAPNARRESTGRHRAKVAAPNPAPPTIEPAREELVHTLRVGAVSATIVLVLFVAALLGLAMWLP